MIWKLALHFLTIFNYWNTIKFVSIRRELDLGKNLFNRFLLIYEAKVLSKECLHSIQAKQKKKKVNER
jgi:hypothetical protein